MYIEKSQQKYRTSKFLWDEQKYLIINFWMVWFNLFLKVVFTLSYRRNNVHSEEVYEPVTGFYKWLNAEVEAEAFDNC